MDDALDFMKGEYRTRMESCELRQREFEKRQVGAAGMVRVGANTGRLTVRLGIPERRRE